MSREVRSAVLALVVVIGVIFGAAQRGSSDAAAADEAAGAAAGSPAKSVGRSGPPVPADAPAPAPEVDELGTRHLTGHDGRTVALTFDDGPHPDQTPRVLEILREHDVVATFCVVGPNAERMPELVRQIAADGHTLCNHTVSHDMNLPDRSPGIITDEVGVASAAIQAAAPDADVPFFRAPGGNFAANVNAVAAGVGQAALGWSIDPHDWRDSGVRTIRDRVLEGMHPGAVVLLHDGGGDRSGTIAALPGIIEALRDAGYEFVVPVA